MASNRDQVQLACGSCKRKNYVGTKNKRTHPERVEYRKYCRFCRSHTPHKEAR